MFYHVKKLKTPNAQKRYVLGHLLMMGTFLHAHTDLGHGFGKDQTPTSPQYIGNQTLADIIGVKPYLETDGYLTIKPDNCKTLLQNLCFYAPAFSTYDGGVNISGWKSSDKTDFLSKLLLGFNKIKKIKLSSDLNDPEAVIRQSVRFYRDLEVLDLSNANLLDNCHSAP